MKIAVVCAMQEEADPLLRRLDGRAAVEHEVVVSVCGFGKVNAAVATTALIATTEPGLVLAVGVCGRLVPGDDTTFWVSHAVQHDYGAIRGGGFDRYSAGELPLGPPAVEPFAAMADPGLGLPHATIASGDAFVEDPDHARRLADELGATVVDMEVAAMAQAATALDVRWAAIKSVTDDADDAGATDFETNLAAAADRAAAATIRLLELLAT